MSQLFKDLPTEVHLDILSFCNELDLIFVISKLSTYWYNLIKNSFIEIHNTKLSYFIQKHILEIAKEINQTKITKKMIELRKDKSQFNINVIKTILNSEIINHLLFYNVRPKPKANSEEEKSGFGGFLQKLFSKKKKEEEIIVNNLFDHYEVVKLILLGAKKTGKSTYLQLLQNDTFQEYYFETISGFDVTMKRLLLENEVEKNNRYFKLQVWDCAQEQFRVTSAYYKAANVILFFFDICDRNTLTFLENKFEVLPIVNTFNLLVGAKCDKEKEREVSVKEAEAVAKRIGIPYIECSSKTKLNVETLLIYSILVKYFFSSPQEIKFL